jgi:hypothetical protein
MFVTRKRHVQGMTFDPSSTTSTKMLINQHQSGLAPIGVNLKF